MAPTVDSLRLDGNAAAGLLQEIFAFEITAAITTCDGCDQPSPVGALLFYAQQLGAVLRCPACNHVMMVVTHPHDEWWLDLRGVRIMQVAKGESR